MISRHIIIGLRCSTLNGEPEKPRIEEVLLEIQKSEKSKERFRVIIDGTRRNASILVKENHIQVTGDGKYIDLYRKEDGRWTYFAGTIVHQNKDGWMKQGSCESNGCVILGESTLDRILKP